MFIRDSTIEKVKSIDQNKDNLIICYADKGVARYNGSDFAIVSELPSWYARIFHNLFLFQPENGGNVYYFDTMSSCEQPKINMLEESLYLFRSMDDGRHIFIPKEDTLQVFDRQLQLINSFHVGKIPAGVSKGNYYRLYPHLTCFSLASNTKIWELPEEALLQKKSTIPGSYFYVMGDLLILRSRFTDDSNYLTAVNASTGEIIWQHRGYIPATIFIGKAIYTFYYHDAPRLQGRWLSIDSLNGQILREADITEELRAHSLRTGDTYLLAKDQQYLFAAGVDGKALYAFNTDTGKIDWQYKFEASAGWLSDLKFHDNKLFVTDYRNNLYIFRRD